MALSRGGGTRGGGTGGGGTGIAARPLSDAPSPFYMDGIANELGDRLLAMHELRDQLQEIADRVVGCEPQTGGVKDEAPAVPCASLDRVRLNLEWQRDALAAVRREVERLVGL